MYGIKSRSFSLPMLSFIRAARDFDDNKCINLMYCLKNIVIKHVQNVTYCGCKNVEILNVIHQINNKKIFSNRSAIF
jgi:hypothetical protein